MISYSTRCVKTRCQNTKVHRYYVRNGNIHKGKAFCGGTRLPANRAEQQLAAKEHNHMVGVQQKADEPSGAEAKKDRENKSLAARAQYRLVRLLELYEAGGIDKEVLRQKFTRFTSKHLSRTFVSARECATSGLTTKRRPYDADIGQPDASGPPRSATIWPAVPTCNSNNTRRHWRPSRRRFVPIQAIR